MKKIYISIMIIALITLTGCGNTKTLTCSMEKSGQKQEGRFTFKKDSITKFSSVISRDYSGAELDEKTIKATKTDLDDVCKSYKSDGVDCKTEVTSKKASVTVSVNVDKASEEILEDFAVNSKEIKKITYDDLKKSLTDGGYTCK